MSHRRAFSLLLMLSLLLAACAKGASDSSSDPNPPGATQPDTWNNLTWNQDNWS